MREEARKLGGKGTQAETRRRRRPIARWTSLDDVLPREEKTRETGRDEGNERMVRHEPGPADRAVPLRCPKQPVFLYLLTLG